VGGVIYPTLDFPKELYSEKKLCPILSILKEGAEVSRLSARTVRDYVKPGEIRGRIIGKQWRFKRADLDAFFENAPSTTSY
jgi:excisionase family DNA binding protein